MFTDKPVVSGTPQAVPFCSHKVSTRALWGIRYIAVRSCE